jgi:phosphomannomutase
VRGTIPSADLAARARAWIAQDPDPGCREELERLLVEGPADELADRFSGELRFGTAGLRGPLGAGPARMNRATVRRATAGLARYLLDAVPGAAQAGVVVGHDARHGSRTFAEETARVLSGAGLSARALPPHVPTPVLAFAVRHLGCAAGVMVTASHNPPRDNGYKIYLGDGVQIAPPVDEAIAQRIQAIERLGELPLGAPGEPVGEEVVGAYLDATVAPVDEPSLQVVYTPLHGVGRDVLLRAFARAGIPAPHVVAAQSEPDPDFPTVARPNPEEPGTLDRALAEAERRGADLMLATDPDADRLAVAVPARIDGWRVLTGDEIGVLLGDHLMQRARGIVASSVASSTMLRRIARAHGCEHRETLTGFKWLMHSGPGRRPDPLLFAYEEALGYAVNAAVRDKDGISAAVLLYGVAAAARRDGTDLLGRLDALAARFGLHATQQVSVELDPERAEEAMRRLRSRPPSRLLDEPVTDVEDLLVGERLPSADVLVLRCREHLRAVARPSGTEPKLKLYLQVVETVGGDDVDAVRLRAGQRLEALAGELRAAILV